MASARWRTGALAVAACLGLEAGESLITIHNLTQVDLIVARPGGVPPPFRPFPPLLEPEDLPGGAPERGGRWGGLHLLRRGARAAFRVTVAGTALETELILHRWDGEGEVAFPGLVLYPACEQPLPPGDGGPEPVILGEPPAEGFDQWRVASK
jgi:hypothetical protein